MGMWLFCGSVDSPSPRGALGTQGCTKKGRRARGCCKELPRHAGRGRRRNRNHLKGGELPAEQLKMTKYFPNITPPRKHCCNCPWDVAQRREGGAGAGREEGVPGCRTKRRANLRPRHCCHPGETLGSCPHRRLCHLGAPLLDLAPEGPFLAGAGGLPGGLTPHASETQRAAPGSKSKRRGGTEPTLHCVGEKKKRQKQKRDIRASFKHSRSLEVSRRAAGL